MNGYRGRPRVAAVGGRRAGRHERCSRVHVVLPGDVDDPRSPSGGNTYGRRVARELAALGWTVARHRVAGSWPRPAAAEEAGLARLLAAVPDGETVLLDGLVACGVPEAVVPQAGRVRLVVLVHLPLADEVGLPADVAADLDARERATLRAADAIVVTSAAAARQLALPTGRDAGPGAGSDAAGAGSAVAGRSRPRAVLRGPRAVDRALPPCSSPSRAPTRAGPVGTDGASALVCVAAVTPVKGHDVLVDALAEVADRPWTCVCAGPLDRTPDHVAEVRRRIDRAGLTDRVRLVGPLDPTALDATYATADLAVLASRTETYGMAAAEALARGLPLVATTGGGLPDTVGHAPDGTRPGLLVPPDDPTALAAALRRWFDEPAPPCPAAHRRDRPRRVPPQLERDGRGRRGGPRPRRARPAPRPDLPPRRQLPERVCLPRTWRTGRTRRAQPRTRRRPRIDHAPRTRPRQCTGCAPRSRARGRSPCRRRSSGPSRRGAAAPVEPRGRAPVAVRSGEVTPSPASPALVVAPGGVA